MRANMAERPILIADDEPDDVSALLRVFQAVPIVNDVRVVKDGAEAIAYLEGTGRFSDRETHPYPILLFLDLKMPQFSGWDVLKYLHGKPEHSNLRVVVFTNVGNIEDIRQAYNAGAHSFLVKPVSKDDFHNLIRCLSGIELWPVENGNLVRPVPHSSGTRMDERGDQDRSSRSGVR